MAQVHKASPYTTAEVIPYGNNGVPVYALPESAAYAVPGVTAADSLNGIMNSPIGAYAPGLKEEIGQTPDPFRLGHMTQRTVYPEAGRPAEEYYRRRDADKKARHSVETQDADGWEENKGQLKRFADNPRSIPVPETRPTMKMAPRTYTFLRQMVGAPQRFTGEHFSMADHRRTYNILGTQPVRTWRNTYRIDPVPWDSNVVDMPAPTGVGTPQAILSIEVPQRTTFRL